MVLHISVHIFELHWSRVTTCMDVTPARERHAPPPKRWPHIRSDQACGPSHATAVNIFGYGVGIVYDWQFLSHFFSSTKPYVNTVLRRVTLKSTCRA